MNLKKLDIPKSPGCYQFFNKEGEIIYIGKAANLKSRVFSYWRDSANHSPAKYSMMKQISKVKIIKTESEIEALLLEANLIKKYQPQYNIIMRDDKRYAYIKISIEDEWPRVFLTRKIEHTGRYFGPFVSTEHVKTIIKIMRKIWPFRTCVNLPKKPCLYYSINKCPGMCKEHISAEEYGVTIKQIILFLEGKKRKIITNYKLQITNLIKSKDSNNDQEIARLKYQLANIEKVIEQANPLSLGDKYAADTVELAKVLGLKKVPERIEGYDIANIFGRQAVGSMVVFNNGAPEKNQYRKFRVKHGQGEANDIKMLKEVLERRFNNEWPEPDLIIIDGGKGQLNAALGILKKIKKEIPVISISKGQGLRSSRAPDKLFFPGQAKPLELSLNSPALHLLKRVRDEAHRFAIEYHRKLRKKVFLNN